MKYIVTNFAYGTGPFIRTTEFAIAFNRALEASGQERMGIIVPLVYGDKQKRIMFTEEFRAHEEKYPGEILLDPALGAKLKSIFYGDKTYAEALAAWVNTIDAVEQDIHAHLSGPFEVQNAQGESIKIDGRDIVIELNRSPRVRYGIAPVYSTTFGHIAEILEASLTVEKEVIAVPDELLKRGITVAERVESVSKFTAMAYPATFSWADDWKPRYGNEILVPPITSQQTAVDGGASVPEGILVTVTGIPGLERLYSEARELGLALYANDTDAVPGSTKMLPNMIESDGIQFQFARAGWGSVWLSLFTGTPIVVPDFDKTDDPEIYWNNRAVEKLGIGIVYRGQPLQEILALRENVKRRCADIVKDIVTRFGSHDGHEVFARKCVEDFLKTRA